MGLECAARRHSVASAALCALSVPAFAQEPTPTIRVDVRLVRILADGERSVRRAGWFTRSRPISKSATTGFSQQISVFERQTEQPLSIAVLIDNSGSTAKDLKYETDSVTRFVAR